MGRFEIIGGKKLDGTVEISSAKNAVLPFMSAAILTEQEVVIKNCPKILDVFSMCKILTALNVKNYFVGNDLVIKADNINGCRIDESLSKELRSSVFMVGSLVGRLKCAGIAYPGGCEIGKRPIDIHVKALKRLGVKIEEEDGYIYCSAKKIKGAEITLDFPSVGATENVMICAALSSGKTILKNCAKEPEIIDLMNFLNSMGAKIFGAGTNEIVVYGVKKLHGTIYTPISDRIEAGTFIIATLITGGNVEIKNVNKENISFLVNKICNNTCKMGVSNDIIHIKENMGKGELSLITAPYPGFPTDMQAQTVAYASTVKGISKITETVFENRFGYVKELLKMGADIKIADNTAIVNGVKTLHGAEVFAKDLRGGAALVLAGLFAQGKTIVHNISNIQRGYVDLDKKLLSLGADIKKLE